MNFSQPLLTFALAAVAAAFSLAAHGDDCGKGTRVALPECVSAPITNNDRTASVTNNRAWSVKVKVDIRGLFCEDAAAIFGPGVDDSISTPGSCRVDSVKCCADSSVGGCDQTWESLCERPWQESSASASCSAPSFYYDEPTGVCSIRTRCLDYSRFWVPTSINQHSDDVRYLSNCNAKLTAGSC